MAPAAAILTLGEWFAIFDVVVVGTAPRAKEGVVVGAVSPGVIKVVMCMGDLIVGHLLKGQCAIDDVGGNAIVGIGLGQGLGTLKVLDRDVS